jgi:trk system potassium uptake protein TrkA
MSIYKSYAVFGLGRFGYAVAKELAQSGAEVLAVDANEAVVNAVSGEIPLCKCADVTDPEVLDRLGIAGFDVVIVAMANSLEASVLTTTLCKELGVKNVIVKCANELQKKILTRVGADRVVFPESESGVRMAKNLLSSGFVDLMELSRGVSMIQLDVRQEWLGKSIIELNLRKKYAINVVAIRKGASVDVNVRPDTVLDGDMKLIVIANSDRLNKLR